MPRHSTRLGQTVGIRSWAKDKARDWAEKIGKSQNTEQGPQTCI